MSAAVTAAIKAVATVATSKEGRSKVGKVILGILIGIVVILVVIVMCFLSLVKAFLPDGPLPSSDAFRAQDTQIYKSVNVITTPFYDSIRKQMEEERQKIIDENTITESVKDDLGNVTTVTKCNVKITRIVNYIELGYLISYLTYADAMDETGRINEELAKKFLEENCSIRVTKVSENEYQITNIFLSQEELAEKYFSHDEAKKQQFELSCRAYGEFFTAGEASVDEETVDIYEISNGGSVNLLEMPLYLQYLGPWASMPYGNGTIAQKGCAPTCLAMVLSFLKQEVILPNDVTSWTGNDYYVMNAGSSWSIFPAVSEHWGIGNENLGHSQNAMLEALSEGKPVIASMGPGTFTKGGHFIVLTGITENGKIKVNDPNDSDRKNHKDMEFDVSLIMRESKNFWSFWSLD